MSTTSTRVNLNFIKSKRLEKGINISRMASELGLKSPSNYYKYESGEYALRADMLPTIANILECNVEDFFC
ncbi:MAG: helix-turn-helix transcriptional regulator [Clostridiales bacterium]|nr:helix-turn-helix transcriptional regulator [Clostridiales bacterium]